LNYTREVLNFQRVMMYFHGL